jgi:glycosyltransferase involved in cell wall biosynthesis
LIDQKVVLVGPVFPYKGGIAHYTSLLFNNLSKRYDTTLISFKRLYPKLLYPGKMQKDYQSKTFEVMSVEYLIDAINPLSWVWTAKKIISIKPDLTIIQWWNPFFAPAYLTMIVVFKMFIKTKVLFICHNILPHEKMPLDKLITKIALKKGDYYIVQSQEDEEKLLRIVENAKYKITPHPSYSVFNIKSTSKNEARIKLGIKNKEKVLLFFGFIREYKGLIYLIQALPRIKNKYPNVKLLIAGEFFDEKYYYLDVIEKLQLQSDILIFDQYIPDDEVNIYFTASDLVVLPYNTATQSGIIQIAFGFAKPVIVTNVGGLPEVVEHNQTGYVVKPQDPQSITEAIIDYFDENKASKFEANIIRQIERFSWDRLIDAIEELSFYKHY